MPRPSAADLIERLRDVYEQREGVRLADEKLAGRLPISLSTFNRWKKTDTRSYSDLMAMLELAGWLTLDAATVPAQEPARPGEVGDELEAIRLGQQRLARELALLRRDAIAEINSLRAHLDDLPSAGRSFPRPRQGRTASR